MKLGLQVASFTWPGGVEQIGPTLARIAQAAEAAGFSSLWVMDHFYQIEMIGKTEEPMLEAYSALNFVAAVTHRIRLGALVTGVIYRYPGLLAKTVTTLDVYPEDALTSAWALHGTSARQSGSACRFLR
jgi:alkanesulfonate monooxygenase SsuD/methylene tetrahydromethanopterin reductase-like flavin-dependent oxidoreductase (luciferase family)